MAKRFFYVCAGLFLLALSYHLGAGGAMAQAGSTGFGYTAVGTGVHYVMTPNGDIYVRYATGGTFDQGPPQFVGNFWGGATAGVPTTWGKVKAEYRK